MPRQSAGVDVDLVATPAPAWTIARSVRVRMLCAVAVLAGCAGCTAYSADKRAAYNNFTPWSTPSTRALEAFPTPLVWIPDRTTDRSRQVVYEAIERVLRADRKRFIVFPQPVVDRAMDAHLKEPQTASEDGGTSSSNAGDEDTVIVEAPLACSVGSSLGAPLAVFAGVDVRDDTWASAEILLARTDGCEERAVFRVEARSTGGLATLAAELGREVALQLNVVFPTRGKVLEARGTSGSMTPGAGEGVAPGQFYAVSRAGVGTGLVVVRSVSEESAAVETYDGTRGLIAGDDLVRADVNCCHTLVMPIGLLRTTREGEADGTRLSLGLRYRWYASGLDGQRVGAVLEWLPGLTPSVFSIGAEYGYGLTLWRNRVRVAATVGGFIGEASQSAAVDDAEFDQVTFDADGAYATATFDVSLRVWSRWWLYVEAGVVGSKGFSRWKVDDDAGPDVDPPAELTGISLRSPVVRFGLTYGPQ